MKKIFLVLFVFLILFTSGCVQQKEIEKEKLLEKNIEQQNTKKINEQKAEQINEPINTDPLKSDEKLTDITTPRIQSLGNLCVGETECNSFCLNNHGRCEKYCEADNGNMLCALLFPQTQIPSCGDKKELFTVSPVALEDLEQLVPLGSLNPSSHVFPTDHIYIIVKNEGASTVPKRARVISPGRIYLTAITSSEHTSVNPPFTDYDLEFYSCKEVYAKFGHVRYLSSKLQDAFTNAYGDCTSYETGGTTYRRCSKKVSLELEAGEEIGAIGGFENTRGLDFWLADYRIDKIKFANPARWGEISAHITCPIDYFTSDFRNKMYSLFVINVVPRTIEPICGTIAQDSNGTAQGVWFVKGTKITYPEDPHMALAHDNFNPLKAVFSVGTSIPGLETGAYYFDPQGSGFVNTDFKDAKSGSIYCYDSLTKRFDNQVSSMRIILQLTSATTLKIEKQNMKECGDGPWAFSSNFV